MIEAPGKKVEVQNESKERKGLSAERKGISWRARMEATLPLQRKGRIRAGRWMKDYDWEGGCRIMSGKVDARFPDFTLRLVTLENNQYVSRRAHS